MRPLRRRPGLRAFLPHQGVDVQANCGLTESVNFRIVEATHAVAFLFCNCAWESAGSFNDFSYSVSIRIDMSSQSAEWVMAPTEMKSMPVSA